MTVRAIPVRYAGVQFRSRLEAKYAALFDLMSWGWEYEPAADIGHFRIPDFLMGFAVPTIIECKPAVTWQETLMHCRALVARCADWLCADAEAELALLELLPDETTTEDDLRRIDALVHQVTQFRDHHEGLVEGASRAAVVVGTVLHERTVPVSYTVIDSDELAFIRHGDHVGLAQSFGGRCLVCGATVPEPDLVPSRDIFALWREAGNKVQWRPPRSPT